MSLLKLPIVNALFISGLTTFYSFIFIFTANHIEFLSMLSSNQTLSSPFWNGWSDFVRAGNLKYVGYLFIAITVFVLFTMLVKRTKKYDEYQTSMLARSLLVAGVLSILMIPFIMILLLSDPNYSVETILFFVTIQWFGVLATDLFYVLRY